MICLKHWVFHDQESPKRHFFAQSLVLRPPKRKFGKCSQPCGSSGCLNSTILSANEGEIKEWGKIPMHLYITKYSPDWASLDVIVFARHSALHKDSRFHVIPHGCKLSASGMSKTGGQNTYSYRIYSYYRCKSATVWKRSEVTALRPSKLWNKKVCKLFLGSPWWGVPKYLHWTQKKSKPCSTAKALEGVCTPELIPTFLCQAQRGFSSNSIHCRQQTSRINKRNPWCRGRFSSTSGEGKNHRPPKKCKQSSKSCHPMAPSHHPCPPQIYVDRNEQ